MESFTIIGFLIVIAFLLISFLLLREVILWYYKINKSIDLQIETNNHLKKLIEQNETIINQFKKDENNQQI
jgi:CHASE3 domain sensor protein